MTPSLKLNMMRDQAQRNISLSADYADYVEGFKLTEAEFESQKQVLLAATRP